MRTRARTWHGGEPMGIDHDGLFKELLLTFFREFLELFAPDVLKYGDPTDISPAATETFLDAHDMGQRRSDLVIRVKFADGSGAFFLIHIEIESQVRTDVDFAKRMFRYFARLHELHDEPVYPIALFAFDAPGRDEPDTYRVAFPDRDVLRFEFLKIHLRKLHWRDFVNRDNPLAAALMAKMGYTKQERPRVKLECLRLLAKLEPNPDKQRLIGRFVETYLALDETEVQQYNELMEAMPLAEKQAVTEVLTYWERLGLEKGFHLGREEGRQEGRQEGRLEGLEEGREQGRVKMRNMLLSLVEARFGPVPEHDRLMLDRLTLEALEGIGDAAVKADTYDDVRTLLHQHVAAGNDTDS